MILNNNEISYIKYPATRMRRLRTDKFIRNLVCEYRLSVYDLILPVFVVDNKNYHNHIDKLPGVYQLGFKQLIDTCKKAQNFNIQAIALFPVISDDLKSENASEAYNTSGLVTKAIKLIKKNFPNLGVIVDVALDPYTSHGHDGILKQGRVINNSPQFVIDNDQTLDVLSKQALCYAQAGADIIAPSDMMDGRIAIIRQALENNGFHDCKILSYAVKYCSALYKPFRKALNVSVDLGSEGKSSYQMDVSSKRQALSECQLDVSEGADMLLVKPAGFYGDIIHLIKSRYNLPLFGYQVSGEYAMIKAAANNNYLDEQNTVLEIMMCLKRAGCDGIISYYALEVAQWLEKIS